MVRFFRVGAFVICALMVMWLWIGSESRHIEARGLQAQGALTSVGTIVPSANGTAPVPVVTGLPVAPDPKGSFARGELQVDGSKPDEYVARVEGRFSGQGCVKAQLDYGDGWWRQVTCLPENWDAYIGAFHTYYNSTSYYPRMIVATQDGREWISPQNELETTIARYIDSGDNAVKLGSRVEIGIFWGGVALVGLLVWKVRWRQGRRKWWAALGVYGVVWLILVTWVPPFSYASNPLATYMSDKSDYSYDPRLPFRNGKIIAEDPTWIVSPQLDKLLGKTGLDPLDPLQPLVKYEAVSVRPISKQPNVGYVTVRMMYKDGAERLYDFPVLRSGIGNTFVQNWTGLAMGRLETEHDSLLGIPLTSEEPDALIRLGTPTRLDLPDEVERLDEHNIENWVVGYGYDPRKHKIAWSPDGDRFLVAGAEYSTGQEGRELWLVKVDGSSAKVLTEKAIDFAWSPDGNWVIFNEDGNGAYAVMATDKQGEGAKEIARMLNRTLPGVTNEGVWFSRFELLTTKLLMHDFNGAEFEITDLKGSDRWTAVVPSKDGQQIAYTCGDALCLEGRAGGGGKPTEGRSAQEVEWRNDGKMLATVSWDELQERWGTSLQVLDGDGKLVKTLTIAPDGQAARPQWSPDGRYIYVQTFPYRGRRMVVVDTVSWDMYDITPPLWDSVFALSPDGGSVLLTNGRGGFWQAKIELGK